MAGQPRFSAPLQVSEESDQQEESIQSLDDSQLNETYEKLRLEILAEERPVRLEHSLGGLARPLPPGSGLPTAAENHMRPYSADQ